MWQALIAFISAIPSAATSPLALGAYALAAAVFALSLWRVSRNKNLLANLQKLPPKDRMKALEIEMQGVRVTRGISPEQWVRSRIHRYYFLAFLAICAAAVTILALAIFGRYGDPPRTGSTFIGNLQVVERQFLQINNNQPIGAELKQQIQEAIELTTRREFARAQDAFMRLPESARVPAVWNDLGVAYEGLGNQSQAREAYAKALQQQPDFKPAQANLARLTAQPSVASPQTGADNRITAGQTGPVVNLLASDQGGHLVVAPGDEWRKITSGKEEDKISVRAEADAIYAFKDKKPATFRTFAMLITQTDIFNPKDVEISAADDSYAGPFRFVTTCTMVNALIMEARHQQCDFPETTARYVKIKLVSTYHFNKWANIPQIRLLGRLAQ